MQGLSSLLVFKYSITISKELYTTILNTKIYIDSSIRWFKNTECQAVKLLIIVRQLYCLPSHNTKIKRLSIKVKLIEFIQRSNTGIQDNRSTFNSTLKMSRLHMSLWTDSRKFGTKIHTSMCADN